MATLQRVVIAGGSIAAVTAAESLRLEGFDGDITLLSDEHHSPYSRAPLSKGVLGGKESVQSALLPPLGQDINVRLGVKAGALRPDRQRVLLGGWRGSPIRLLQWQGEGLPVAAVAVNHRLSIVKLKKLGANASRDAKAALA